MKTTSEKEKNITRYDYCTADYTGWRLSIMRGGRSFVQYFSDRQYGSKEASHKAAIEKREEIYNTFSKVQLGGASCINDIRQAYGDILEGMRIKLAAEMRGKRNMQESAAN